MGPYILKKEHPSQCGIWSPVTGLPVSGCSVTTSLRHTAVGGENQRDKQGNPTGLLIAKPNASILYSTLAKGPKLSREDQMNSTRHFMRELNRFGITSAIDAGGGFQNYPHR